MRGGKVNQIKRSHDIQIKGKSRQRKKKNWHNGEYDAGYWMR